MNELPQIPQSPQHHAFYSAWRGFPEKELRCCQIQRQHGYASYAVLQLSSWPRPMESIEATFVAKFRVPRVWNSLFLAASSDEPTRVNAIRRGKSM